MNFHGPPTKIMRAAGPGSDENYAALREAVLSAERRKPRAANDRAKGPTRNGCRGVIIQEHAHQHALQDVVG